MVQLRRPLKDSRSQLQRQGQGLACFAAIRCAPASSRPSSFISASTCAGSGPCVGSPICSLAW
eukprot:4682880-Prymnesium_polylepis.1